MNWFVTGINYLKANLEQRQDYSLSPEAIDNVYDQLKESGINNALIISTCNRTEFFLPYEFRSVALEILEQLIYKRAVQNNLFHVKSGKSAVDYFFRICSGLESQIPGDFEILGQVKKSCSQAKKKGMLSGVWQRMINSGLHAAKKARSKTDFFSGASSTSYACVEYLKKNNFDFDSGKFLLIGTGKIGTHTIEHILKHSEKSSISISNRTEEKALLLAEKYLVEILSFNQLSTFINEFDVIICATNAPEYIITPEMLSKTKRQIFIDLSVPLNIDPKIQSEGTVLLNVDKLSKIVNENLEKRLGEVAKVETIIGEEIHELDHWYTIRTGMPLLSELKEELHQLKSEVLSKIEDGRVSDSSAFLDEYTNELFDQLSQEWIKKVRNRAIDAK